MNKLTFIFLVFFTTAFVKAQVITNDSLNLEIDNKIEKVLLSKTDEIKQQIEAISNNQQLQLTSLFNELKLLSDNINNTNATLDSLKSTQVAFQTDMLGLQNEINSLKNQLNTKVNDLKIKTNELDATTNTLSVGLINTENSVVAVTQTSSNNANSITTVNEALSQKQQYGLIFLGLFLILVLAVYAILTKRQNTDTKKLAKKQQEIFEKQIQDGQQLADWLSNQTTNSLGKSAGGEVDHSFAKRVADEIVRITTNLSRMDASIKGHKQLSASVRKLEQSLNSNNYELEVLLNKPYDNGMNLQANFVTDENLKEGESVITRIIKPQINYKGKLIQAAQVEVSQGE